MTQRLREPPSFAMVLLDSRFFPHIFDMIIDHLDFPGSVVAVQVSTDWRKKANRILLRRVVAEPTDGGLLLIPTASGYPDVRPPRYFVSHEALRSHCRKRDFQLRSNLGPASWPMSMGNRPTLPSGDLQALAMGSPDLLTQELLDTIEVLEIYDASYSGEPASQGTKDAIIDVHRIAWALQLQNLRVLRQHYTGRMVFHREGIACDVDTQVYFNIKKDSPLGGSGPRVGTINFGHAKRVVLNTDYFPASTSALTLRRGCQAYGLSLSSQGSLDELVIVMRNGESWDRSDDKMLGKCARNVVRFLNFIWAVDPVTLVGLETFFKSKRVYEKFRAKLMEAAGDTDAAQRRHPNRPAKILRDIGTRFQVFTHEKYRERVGCETYTLYTVQ